MHVTIHTSQTWADTFISELNDTHVEAELRTKHIPPQVPHPCSTSTAVAAVCLHFIRIQCSTGPTQHRPSEHWQALRCQVWAMDVHMRHPGNHVWSQVHDPLWLPTTLTPSCQHDKRAKV